MRVKTCKRKIGVREGYKWPYHDSYAPDLKMNVQDRRVVKKGLKRQYFPNARGEFNFSELKGREKGIKSIEKQYIHRLQASTHMGMNKGSFGRLGLVS